MDTTYQYTDVRALLKRHLQAPHLSAAQLAKASRINPSYFSRVMVGKAAFSAAQLFAIGKNLGLPLDEIDYLLLLGEREATDRADFRGHLDGRIDATRRQKLKLENRLKSAGAKSAAPDPHVYFAEWLTTAVHMALTIDRFRADPKALGPALGITPAKLAAELDKLEALGVITRKKGAVVVDKDFVHLDASHPLSAQNHLNWRLEGVAALARRDQRASDYHFTAAFSANRKVLDAVAEAFRAFVLDAQRLVRDGGKEERLCAMTFDLRAII